MMMISSLHDVYAKFHLVVFQRP